MRDLVLRLRESVRACRALDRSALLAEAADEIARLSHMDTLTFTIEGDPVPQPRARISTRGGFGRAYTPGDHPIHAYRAAVAAAAREAGATPSDQVPITLIVDLVFARPKSHYRKSGLKPDAPKLPRADCSNVLKGIEDSLNGVAWVDDTQVGKVIVEKSFGSEGRTTIRIT
jgi:Holliday junction resolvase RusA-like endonuclease